MARKLTRREIGLLGMLGAAAIGVSYFSGDDAPTGTPGAAGAGPGGTAAQAAAPVVAMARLERPVESYDARGRNLFQYYTPPPPEPPPTPIPVATPFPTPPPTPVPVIDRGPVVPPQPKPPPVSFTYLGFLGPKEAPIAILEVASDMVLARKGDIVHQHFRIEGFGYETVIIGYVDERFRGQTTELKQTQGSRKR